MKLQDTRSAHDTYTGKASEISRQLALAALALVWIFKVDKAGTPVAVPHALLWPSILAVSALASDLSQYVYASIVWGVFDRRAEKREELNEDVEFEAPRWINWPTNAFFFLKLALVAACYYGLLNFMLRALAH